MIWYNIIYIYVEVSIDIWFFSQMDGLQWKIPSRNGWWLGVPPFVEPPIWYKRCSLEDFLKWPLCGIRVPLDLQIAPWWHCLWWRWMSCNGSSRTQVPAAQNNTEHLNTTHYPKWRSSQSKKSAQNYPLNTETLHLRDVLIRQRGAQRQG